jgi:two-component system sensor histidine kinase RegB
MRENNRTRIKPRQSGGWIRLRTLVLLRWWAITGQIAALVIARRLYDLHLEIGLCFLVVGLSVIINLVVLTIYPQNKRLSEREIFLFVLYDMLQLGLLLYLTGGLNNPFSILIVVPVAVSASALSTRSTVVLGLMAILLVTLLAQFNLPLQTFEREILKIPDVFLYGNWLAIVIGVVFLGVYARWIISEMQAMSDALQATQMALAREQKLTDLGGVVAAAAHELGTPLATIKLASSELADELTNEDQREDALLISEQADRCRDILRSMGRAGKDDLHLKRAPLTALIEEAAEPHLTRGKPVHFDFSNDASSQPQPDILRQPEIIHGLRNLIQNAVDYADKNIWVECRWSSDTVTLRIMDDGPGFPPHLLGRIGDPLMRRRPQPTDFNRPEYEGMGLGLFIAKTLLERSGADLSFANGPDVFKSSPARQIGAVVEVIWPRRAIEADRESTAQGLGENKLIQP